MADQELVVFSSPGEVPFVRVAENFLYPTPTALQRLAKFASDAPYIPYSAPEYVPAFDVAKWQLVVDYIKAFAGGYRLVIIKATEGLPTQDYTGVDPYFESNWRKAFDAGFLIMTYHFFRSHLDGDAQAHFHLKTVQPLRDAGAKIAVWADLESADGVANTVRKPRFFAFLDAIHKENLPTGPYSSNNYWPSLMDGAVLPAIYKFWIAHWTPALNPTVPKGITQDQAVLWQDAVYPTYSWGRPVPGVSKAVDNDRWRGSLQSLEQYLGYSHPEPTDEEKLAILWREAQSHGWNLNP